jgi:hypothetical protein
VFGGMIAATFIAILFVPLFFKWLERGKQLIPAGLEEHKKPRKHGKAHSEDTPHDGDDTEGNNHA